LVGPQENNELGLIEKIVFINRVAKVVKGGRRFSFSALAVVGDGQGKVGYAMGKAKEVPSSVEKAKKIAMRAMVPIKLVGGTLPHRVIGRFGASHVAMVPASPGTGVIAGGPMRSVLEAVGVHNILAKCHGTRNPISVVRATVEGLTSMTSPQSVASKRGKTVEQITGEA